jgi:hypothetical protein
MAAEELSHEYAYEVSPQKQPDLRVIEGGLSDIECNADEKTICVDGTWYTTKEWHKVLGVGQGYGVYADRRPRVINWLLLGGSADVVATPQQAQQLLDEYHDPETYQQPALQKYIMSSERQGTSQNARQASGSSVA